MKRTLKRLNWTEFMALFDDEVHKMLTKARLMDGTTALVLFENIDMCSSQLGKRAALRVGPGCTCIDLDKAAEIWLNDLPSQRQYPCSYTEDVPEAVAAEAEQRE